MRVVSLACSNTEIVCALGCGDWLVGVDDHSDYPEDVVGALPRTGPDLSVDPQAVLALQPDLVLASDTVPGHDKNLAALDAAGIAYLAPAPVSLDDVYADIVQIAGLLGVPERGQALVASMRQALVDQRDVDGPRILVEWWPKPVIVPGRQSWVTDLIELAGGVNPMGDRDVKSSPITHEEGVALEPDAVVVCWCGVPFDKYRPDVVYKREAWRETKALRNEQVHCVPEAFLGRPGPRLVDGYRALREVIRSARPR